MRLLLFPCIAAVSLLFPLTAAADTISADEQILKAAKIGTDSSALLEYLRRRATPRADANNIKRLIRQLGDESFAVREEATAELIRLGHGTKVGLEAVLSDPDVERARRAADCLARIIGSGGISADAAAVRLLAIRKPGGATAVLLNFLPFAGDEIIAAETQDALTTMALRDGKADPVLLAGLSDKDPFKRVGAAVALARAGAVDARAALRGLLKDPDATVRLHVGLALAAGGDKTSVPVLIDLLADLRRPDAWQVEDLLVQLNQGQPPPAPVGIDSAARKKCRDAWAAWWAANGDKVKLAAPTKPLGHTLMLLLDPDATTGVAREVDAQGKTLWEIPNIDFPLDAQLLPHDRLLLAEHHGNRATERDRKGTVVWEKQLPTGPLAAQRLANGHTFLVTEKCLLEVDKDGKELWSYSRSDSGSFWKAQKMPNGDVVCIVSRPGSQDDWGNCFIRLNAQRQEIVTFDLDPKTSGVCTSGGRIEVLPNGHVIVPLRDDNKVAEYDDTGKRVWEAAAEEPVAVVRLPNGHTLVTSFTQRRAVELDRAGREAWAYKGEVRVTRAWRR